jgi:putative transposase
VRSYDFLADRTSDGRPLRMFAIIEEYTIQPLNIYIQSQIKADEVLYKLSKLFLNPGLPNHIRSHKGS